jgi:two-component system response regulator MprA
MTTVLVVDDDQKLLKMVRRTLVYEGFQVFTATNGNEALAQLRATAPDLLILDWLMPELDGLELLTRLREADDNIPVLMLTARDAVEDRVKGLNRGADDYLVKPFAPAELLARLQALLRRARLASPEAPLTFLDLYLNPLTRATRRGERYFELTPKEFELFQLLMQHPRQVLTRNRILEEVWGYDFGGEDNILEVYIGYIRRKTEAGGEPRLIQTVRGVGYILREAT